MTARASITDADRERAKQRRAAFKARWPDEFRDGARCAFLGEYPGPREPGGYPKGFHQWPLDRRDAWWAGFNVGICERQRLTAEESIEAGRHKNIVGERKRLARLSADASRLVGIDMNRGNSHAQDES